MADLWRIVIIIAIVLIVIEKILYLRRGNNYVPSIEKIIILIIVIQFFNPRYIKIIDSLWNRNFGVGARKVSKSSSL